ncbi:MAG: hypothetical protein RKE49_02835 [Oceanicaulis sp.]
MNLLPESATAPPAARRRYFWRTSLSGLVVVATMLAIDMDRAGGPVNIALFTGLALALCAGFYEYFQLLKALDEMQRRIHIGALALAGGVTTAGATLLGLAALVFPIGAPMIVFVGPAFGLGYYAALVIVARHYT